MKRLFLLSLSVALVTGCAQPLPKVAFPDEEVKRWNQPAALRAGAAGLPTPLPAPPSAPVLLGEPTMAGEGLAASAEGERVPPKDAAYVALALPRHAEATIAGIVLGAAQVKGAAASRTRGPGITRCSDDRLLISVGVAGAAPADGAGFALIPASLAPTSLSAPAAELAKTVQAIARSYAGSRGANLSFATAVQADSDPALEMLVGLSKDASRQDCGAAVNLERSLLDDDGRPLSSVVETGCLDDARQAFCSELERPAMCDASALDLAGFSRVAPVPLAVAGLGGGGLVLVEELLGTDSATRGVRLLRGTESQLLGSVTFFTGDPASDGCR